MNWTHLCSGITASLSIALSCHAQTCEPTWSSEFASGDISGVIEDLCVFDDGNGSKLYLAGNLSASTLNRSWRLAVLDGGLWQPITPALFEDEPEALVVHDDGSGSALYAGGRGIMRSSPFGPILSIARWDGKEWSAVGTREFQRIRALHVFDDGSGPALFAAGEAPGPGVWKWDGQSWQRVGASFDRLPETFTVCDLGQGPRLFVGGGFKRVGGIVFNGVAMWDGTAWVQLGTGIRRSSSSAGTAFALESHDDGTGPALFVAGLFQQAGNVQAASIAKWDGSVWSSVGDSNSFVYTLKSVEFGGTKSLVAGGRFTSIGGVTAAGIAQRIGTNWSTMDGSFAGSPTVFAAAIHDFGNGPELAVGGTQFQAASHGGALGGVAKWNGSQWNRLQEGDGLSGNVETIIQSDVSGVDALYVAGSFITAGPKYVGYVARRDETGWHALAGGVSGAILKMTRHNDGSEESIVVAGRFDRAFNSPNPFLATPIEISTKGVALWNGTEWSAMGDGIGQGSQIVTAAASFDDGSGPAVYIAYREFISPSWVYRIERWDGVSWTIMPISLAKQVDHFTVHDDGNGPNLYAAGRELTATHAVLRLDAGQWVGVGVKIEGSVSSMFEFDDGVSGPMLHVSGTFFIAGSTKQKFGARWTGVEWEAILSSGGGTSAIRKYPGGDILYRHSLNIIFEIVPGGGQNFVAWGGDNYASDMIIIVEQGEPVLYMGGSFDRVNGISSRRFGRLELCDPCYADCHRATGVGVLDIFDFLCFQDNFISSLAYACDCDTTTGQGVCDIFDFLCFQDAFVAGCP